MSYDIKFRQRAIAYWAEGHSQRATVAVFKVNLGTLRKWKTQLAKSGSLAPKKRRESWRKIDPERLAEYVSQHPDAYLKEITQEFDCTDVAVLIALRRLNITRKKNYPIQGK